MNSDNGLPVDAKPTIPEVAPLVLAYLDLPGNTCGGSLHIVLDESNVEDQHVLFCLDRAKEIGDAEGQSLAKLLLKMSKTQRLKLSKMSRDELASYRATPLAI